MYVYIYIYHFASVILFLILHDKINYSLQRTASQKGKKIYVVKINI